MSRLLSLASIAVALLVFTALPALAQNKASDTQNTHEGTIVSAKNGQIVMKAKDNTEHTHKLAADAKIFCDGKACTLSDLKPGEKVRVTTKAGDRTTAVRVDALDKNTSFEKSPGK